MYVRLKWPAHNPSSNHRYGVDWKDFLAALGDTTISSSNWSATLPGGLTNPGGEKGIITADGQNKTYIRLSGGNDSNGAPVEVVNTITTSNNNTYVAICEIIVAT